ncbi:MAG TPA: hypothetical protein VNT33_16740 [Telluria sp.]|nr:hypothetical protein [Telluria sp.]
MSEPQAQPFDTRAGFDEQFAACLAGSFVTFNLFDPDFAVFPLGRSDIDAALRRFLSGGGMLQVAMHSTAHVERHYPRFLRLLRDYSHQVECRVTHRALHNLTDSFCIGDGVNMVRRFHSDHLRGEAVYGNPDATEVQRQRFSAIWAEAEPGLFPTTTGL